MPPPMSSTPAPATAIILVTPGRVAPRFTAFCEVERAARLAKSAMELRGPREVLG